MACFVLLGGWAMAAGGARAEEHAPPDGAVLAGPAVHAASPAHRRRRRGAGRRAAARTVPDRLAPRRADEAAGPPHQAALSAPPTADHLNEHTAAISLQGRAGSLGYASSRGTTATTLPPGTFDTGNGLSFLFNYTSESAGNPVGGIRHGAAYADQVLLGADADLGHIFGLSGGIFHFIGTNRDGRSLAVMNIGNTLAPQEIYDGSENLRLTILTYEQKLLDGRLVVEVGRLPAQGAFLVSPLYCDFQNVGICGSPELLLNETNFTFFPSSTYGGHLTYFATDNVFVHAGVFEANPSAFLPSDHGLNFGLGGATGVFMPVEVGYTTDRTDAEYSSNYSIGTIIDRSGYADSVTDVAGGLRLFSGLPAAQRFGRTVAYGRFDQTLYKADSTVLQVFGVAAGATGGYQTQQVQLEFGAVLTGPFAGRPYDTVGLAVTDERFSRLGVANVIAARAAIGLSTTDVRRDEADVELNYGLQLTAGVRLTPNLQYIINPDNINEPFRPKPTPNAFVIGGRLSVDLFTLAGYAEGTGKY